MTENLPPLDVYYAQVVAKVATQYVVPIWSCQELLFL